MMKTKLYTGMIGGGLLVVVLSGLAGTKLDKIDQGVRKFFSSSEIANGSVREKIVRKDSPVYYVARSTAPPVIDAKWDKLPWKDIASLEITNSMGKAPLFRPKTEVKMTYNDECLFLIFRVQDRYVRSVIQKFNGPVYEDAAVEFFFSPDKKRPAGYFDLEINCGGTPLICYVPDKKKFTAEDISQLSIAHSMPDVVDIEIKEPVVWTVECKIPFKLLERFSAIVPPRAGDCWMGNFFKTASKGSNPHYLTWSAVESDKPNFHLPAFFGQLKFM